MKYWIIIDEKPHGPYELDELGGMGLTPETPVWHSGMDDWQPASEIPSLAGCLASVETPDVEVESVTEVPAPGADVEVDTAMPELPAEPPVDEVPPLPAADEPQAPAPAPAAEPQFVYRQWQQPEPQSLGAIDGEPVDDRPIPPAYLGWSIAATLLCCMIPGIIAIIYSSRIPTLYYNGEIDKAYRFSERVEWWLQISIVLGLVSMPMSIFMAAL